MLEHVKALDKPEFKGMVILFRPMASAVCSLGKKPFFAQVTVRYRCEGKIVEFESVQEWLNGLADQEMTIEDMALVLFNELTLALGLVPLRVEVMANTVVHAPAGAILERGGV